MHTYNEFVGYIEELYTNKKFAKAKKTVALLKKDTGLDIERALEFAQGIYEAINFADNYVEAPYEVQKLKYTKDHFHTYAVYFNFEFVAFVRNYTSFFKEVVETEMGLSKGTLCIKDEETFEEDMRKKG
ncbi:MAG: hypothetical protein ACRCZZ_04725 [Phocaeicola sp.]